MVSVSIDHGVLISAIVGLICICLNLILGGTTDVFPIFKQSRWVELDTGLKNSLDKIPNNLLDVMEIPTDGIIELGREKVKDLSMVSVLWNVENIDSLAENQIFRLFLALLLILLVGVVPLLQSICLLYAMKHDRDMVVEDVKFFDR